MGTITLILCRRGDFMSELDKKLKRAIKEIQRSNSYSKKEKVWLIDMVKRDYEKKKGEEK